MSEPVTAARTLRADVAEEVRALLGRRRMTSTALAKTIGKSHTYVWRRLNGETAFDLDDMELIAEALKVPVRELLPQERRGSVINALGKSGDNPRDRPPNRPAGRASGPGRSSDGPHQFIPRAGTTGPRSRSLSR